jgi:hypothetical protein
VAQIDSFSSTDTRRGLNVVFVFPAGSADHQLLAENAAHEVGHSFGLFHQSTYDGNVRIQEYNTNNDSTEKAPIMGLSRFANRGLWWNGPSGTQNPFNGNLPVPQDDLLVITKAANGITYRADDHGNTRASATEIPIVSNFLTAAGIIEQTSDVDYFKFNTPGGNASFNLNPPLGGMLDAKLELFDDLGALLATADQVASSTPASLNESISAVLNAGWYTLAVSSHGLYGDIGQYAISGTPAPEPTGVGVIAILGMVSLLRRRRRE